MIRLWFIPYLSFGKSRLPYSLTFASSSLTLVDFTSLKSLGTFIHTSNVAFLKSCKYSELLTTSYYSHTHISGAYSA